MKRLLLLVSTIAAVALPGAAHGATPCRDRIYNQWYASGKISTDYPIACYRDALKHIPTDASVYSNLTSDIKAALQAALARERDPSPTNSTPSEVGSGIRKAKAPHGTKGASVALGPSSPDHGKITTLAAGKSSGLIASTPVPILVLGAIALALVAAGTVGTGVRYARRRGR